MREVHSTYSKAHLARLLRYVERCETIAITQADVEVKEQIADFRRTMPL